MLTFIVDSRNLSDEANNANAVDRGRADQTVDTGIDDGGACVHVLGAKDGLEWLRFDCFDNEPHYHYVRHLEHTNQVVRFDQFAEGDPEAWTCIGCAGTVWKCFAMPALRHWPMLLPGADLSAALDEVAAVLARLRTA